MLRARHIDCVVIPSPYDEDAHKSSMAHLPPVQQAILLAHGKAHAVSMMHPEAYVIGADQVCDADGMILGKPHTQDRAIAHLTLLQGTWHHQHSAACIFKAGTHLWSGIETVHLQMRSLTQQDIITYIQRDAPFSACGAYCFEKTGHELFTSVRGSADAIKGLPMDSLWLALTQLGCVTS
jgi:septum formation protein